MFPKGKNQVVIGAKKSGIAAAVMLKKYGYNPYVTEIDDSDEIKNNVLQLKKYNIEYETGYHDIGRLSNADFIVLSPGVNFKDFKKLVPEDIKIYSEIEIAFRFIRNKILTITGSNGKTTTTALTAHLLNSSGISSKAVGNIGDPLSKYTDFDGILSVEISSFQLEHIETFKPYAAVILNMTPDHLDRYEKLEDYYGFKARIFENMDWNNFLIYNVDCPVTSEYVKHAKCKKLNFSIKSDKTTAYFRNDHIYLKTEKEDTKLIHKDQIPIIGLHNIYNCMAAILSGKIAGGDILKISEGLKNFTGIPHRLEYVGIANGVKYYNDSKSTNTDSLKYALLSFNVPVSLIAGGKDKMVDISGLNNLIKNKVKNLVLIGQAAQRFKNEWKELTSSVYTCQSMEEAVQTAKRITMPGEIILLSPACSSFDMFNNFEERGNLFKEIVKRLCSLQ